LPVKKVPISPDIGTGEILAVCEGCFHGAKMIVLSKMLISSCQNQKSMHTGLQ